MYALGLLMWHLMSGAQPLSHLATNEVGTGSVGVQYENQCTKHGSEVHSEWPQRYIVTTSRTAALPCSRPLVLQMQPTPALCRRLMPSSPLSSLSLTPFDPAPPLQVLRLKELGWLDEQLPFGAHVPMAYVDLARRCWSPAPMSRPPVTVSATECSMSLECEEQRTRRAPPTGTVVTVPMNRPSVTASK